MHSANTHCRRTYTPPTNMAITRGKVDRPDATPTTKKKEQKKRARSENPDNTPDAIETKRSYTSKVIKALDNAFPPAHNTSVSENQDSEENDLVGSRAGNISDTSDEGMREDDISSQVDGKKNRLWKPRSCLYRSCRVRFANHPIVLIHSRAFVWCHHAPTKC